MSPKTNDTSPLLSRATPRAIAMKNLQPRPYSDRSPSTSVSPSSATTSSPESTAPPPFFGAPSTTAGSIARSSNASSPSRSKVRFVADPRRSRLGRIFAGEDSSAAESVTEAMLGIPPPITASMHMHSTKLPTRIPSSSSLFLRSRTGKQQQVLPVAFAVPHYISTHRRLEHSIQAQLQLLLDDQAAGLAQGGAFSSQDDMGSATGTSSPVTQSLYLSSTTIRPTTSDTIVAGGVVPIRQPKKKRYRLRAARKGITECLQDLRDLKHQESDFIDVAINNVESARRQLDSWGTRLSRFDAEIKTVGSGPRSAQITGLSQERRDLRNEIAELQAKLADLKRKEAHVDRTIREEQNKLDAQLSSYVAARQDAQGEMQRWLEQPSVQLLETVGIVSALQDTIKENKLANGKATNRHVDFDHATSYLDLPPHRRTTELAAMFLTRLSETLTFAKQDMLHTDEALAQGSEIWASTIATVQSFEDSMHAEMTTSISDVSMMKARVKTMSGPISALERYLSIAIEKGWTLLICAIGAELEAFRTGREVLSGLLGLSLDKDAGDVASVEDDEHHFIDKQSCHAIELQEARESVDSRHGVDASNKPQEAITDQRNGAIVTNKIPRHARSESDDDDGPHPDLLMEMDHDE